MKHVEHEDARHAHASGTDSMQHAILLLYKAKNCEHLVVQWLSHPSKIHTTSLSSCESESTVESSEDKQMCRGTRVGLNWCAPQRPALEGAIV